MLLYQYEEDGSEWKLMKPEIFATIMDFFSSGLPVVNKDVAASGNTEILGTVVIVVGYCMAV